MGNNANHKRSGAELSRDMDELHRLVDDIDRAEMKLSEKIKQMHKTYGVDVVVQRVSARHGLRPLFSFVPNPSKESEK